MDASTRDAIDARLPPALRGKEGLPNLLAGIRVRASVAGTGPTFALTRAAHTAMRARRMRVHAHASGNGSPWRRGGGSDGEASWTPAAAIHRKRAAQAVGQSILWSAKRAWPLEALVLESGVDGVLLRDLHELAKATHVLLPGVARDPVDGSVRPEVRRTLEYARSVPKGGVLVCGERDARLRRILCEETQRIGATFVEAAPHDPRGLPGIEVATVLDAFLRLTVGVGLSPAERVQHMARLQRRLHWLPSGLAGLRWFDATGLHSPAGLRAALDHLARTDTARVHAVCYVHRSHRAEAAWLAPVLAQALEDGVLAHLCLIGAGAAPLAERLRHLPTTLFTSGRESVDTVVATLEREARGGAVVTLGDAAGPWPTEMRRRLVHPDAPPDVWSPLAPRTVAAVEDGPAMAGIPVLGAPSMGRRPVVNILGDLDRERPDQRLDVVNGVNGVRVTVPRPTTVLAA